MVKDRSASPIHIVFAADAGYVPWAGVMLASVLRFDHGARLHVHALADGVRAVPLRPLAAMVKAAGARFSVHDAGPLCAAQADRLRRGDYISRATYARFFLGDLLPAAVSRAIYLDVDTLCRASLRDLWDFDLAGAVAAVVRDAASVPDAVGYLAGMASETRARHARRLDLPADATYFNAGIMLIDVGQWRAAEIGQLALQWIAANPDRAELADQDGLNRVLHGRVVRLDDAWNVLAQWAWQEPADSVKILHFAGPDKPWQADYTAHGGAEWRAVKAASPFRDVPLVEPKASATATPPPDEGARRLRVRGVSGTSGCMAGEAIGTVRLARLPSGRSGVAIGLREAALPPGAYTLELVMAEITDRAGNAAADRKWMRFEVCAGIRSLAALELDVMPGTALCEMPVTLAFVLAGPARMLTCWLATSGGVGAKLRVDITLTRLADAWRTALAG